MRSGTRRVAVLAMAAAQLLPRVVWANGGDVHFGMVSTGVPMVALYVLGGFTGLVTVFFVVNWARFRRSEHGEAPPDSEGPGDGGDTHGIHEGSG